MTAGWLSYRPKRVSRQGTDRLAELQRDGLLAAALAWPRTYVGLWLRAVLLRQEELGYRLASKLNGGRQTGWNDDEPAVVQAACELGVGRLFGTSYDVRAVTAFVGKLREATDNDPKYDQLKTEAVIRLALGDRDVDTTGITAVEKYGIHSAALAGARAKLGLSEAEVNQLVTDAEKIAAERGFNPPLAD